MTDKTTLKTRQPSAPLASTALLATETPPRRRAILGIVDHLMNTESLLATAIAAVDSDGVDPEDVQITLVIVRERLHATMERVSALGD